MEFYGYKKCSTCRDAHKYLVQHGIDVEFQDFVVNPPSVDTLKNWVTRHRGDVMPFVNVKGTRFRELGLKDKPMTKEQWLTLLSTDGKLLKRPVLVTEDDVIVGFDKAAYEKLASSFNP
ncbi:Spx/MgsR family RNA polymerase-binding regulatory protein [Alicyclobacillus tolerans]|uniref:arsenate reductase family protein n=1 Tax=Alicyclobacillus tolerans TaxID=90970 RepID=UPI001F3D767E|nr:Spx/MgsR family RNA polymerase-binding regulatory protein [Alicyclobacillus tolerans]MCF8565358.1 Spx/MgsR family RNA polymerase-binding regulatory protein [Alicyclobacillus tolerans]